MHTFRTGAQMYSVRNHTQDEASMRGALKALKEIGYDIVQLSGQSQSISDEAIRGMLDEIGLIAPSTHVSFEFIRDNYDAFVKRHHLWNVEYPGIGAMPGEFRDGAEGFRRFAKEAGKLARRMKGDGLTMVYHNHAFEFERFGGVLGMEILLEEADPALQFELDVYWAQAGGVCPAKWVRRLAGRMDVVHFKDMMGGGEGGPKMAPFGEGNLNFEEIFKACDEIGVKWAFIEQDNAVESDSIACMRTSLVNLQRCLG